MNTAAQVKNYITNEKAKGRDLQDITWEAAKMCVGMPYVYGASGQDCTPSYRRQAYARHGDEHPTIKTACKNFNGDKTCSGCKWYPDGQRVMCFDCRGLTYDMLYLVYGWKLQGGGCTSQWNNADNWTAKGRISDGIPKDKLVCLFYSKDNKEKTWEHTGFCLNGETVEASSGVQYSKTVNKKWTHWALPKCVSGDAPTPPTPTPPTPPPAGKAVVTGKQVALRQGPGTDTPVIVRIATGTTVDIAVISGWTYVNYNGKHGFMMDEFIRADGNKVTVTGKNVALRAGTGTDTRVLTRIPTGTVVEKAELPTGWTYIQYGEKKGFMMDEYIRKG